MSIFGNGANFPGDAWLGVGTPAPGLIGYLVVYDEVCMDTTMYCQTDPVYPANAGELRLWATPNKRFRIVAVGDDAVQYEPNLPNWFIDPDPVTPTGSHRPEALTAEFDGGARVWRFKIVP